MRLHSIRLRLLGLVLATIVPFTALVGFGLWTQWQNDKAVAVRRALIEARLLAAQVDDHVGSLTYLMEGLSRAVSTKVTDVGENDALFRRVAADLPDSMSTIFLFAPDGSNIGASLDSGPHRPNASDRSYFRKVLAGQRLAVSEVTRGRVSGDLVVIMARPIEDRAGKLKAVLAVSTRLKRFQNVLRMDNLPAGSVVRIVDLTGVVVAHSTDGPHWIGRDLSGDDSVRRQIAAGEVSEVAPWTDGVVRITGSSTAHRVPPGEPVGTDTALEDRPPRHQDEHDQHAVAGQHA